EQRIRARQDRAVLGEVRSRDALDGGDRDLGASYVNSQDHSQFLSPGTWPCKLGGLRPPAKIRDRFGVSLDARDAAGADAGPMLISQSTKFSELQSRIHGQVLTEGDQAWDASRQTFNLTHDQRPAALVRVASADDVAETVRYAAQRGLRVAPQGTGHNAGPIEGLEDSLLLRTDALQEVRIDVAARRARVGSGVRWAAVADPASEAGLAPLSGSSRDVGIAGYSLGGGMGWLGRKYGLQANAL